MPVVAPPPRSAPTTRVRSAGPLLPVVGRRMQTELAKLRVYAGLPETVLISGPTGAGKSRLARWIHAESGRADQPFVTVDLLTVPESMQMAELFGWKRGAFSGATRDQEGCVARAGRGTLFIDEVDKLSLGAQAALLQLLETRRFRVLGDPGRERSAPVRILVGTNADLRQQVAEGSFREDLYYRIHVLPVSLPPLRERMDELVGWSRYMIERRHREAGVPGAVRLSPDACVDLLEHDWPGNLRQLDNVLRRAYALALVDARSGEGLSVEAAHVAQALAAEVPPGSGRPDLIARLERAAEAFVDEAQLRQARGDELPLDLAEALRGLVLRAANRRLGDLREAFELLGCGHRVANRNHRRDLRREDARVRRLRAHLSR